MTAAFGFAMMSLFVKLAGDLPAFQKAFFRNFGDFIFDRCIGKNPFHKLLL